MCLKPWFLLDALKISNKSSILNMKSRMQKEEARIKSNLFKAFIYSEVLDKFLKDRNQIVNKCQMCIMTKQNLVLVYIIHSRESPSNTSSVIKKRKQLSLRWIAIQILRVQQGQFKLTSHVENLASHLKRWKDEQKQHVTYSVRNTLWPTLLWGKGFI